jgi:hypothetical protein
MNTPSPSNANAILKQIANIQQMERGKISIIRQTPDGPFYNHQTWEKGRNVSRYLPRDQVSAVQDAINGYQQFKQLAEDYAQHIIEKSRAERGALVKKKCLAKSSSPKMRRSSN